MKKVVRTETHRANRITAVFVSSHDNDLRVGGERDDLLERLEAFFDGAVVRRHVEIMQNDGWLMAAQLVDRRIAALDGDDLVVVEARMQLARSRGIVPDN